MINDIWLSDNFRITVFSGVFASLLVVLLSEIRSYLSLKNNVKNQIFCKTVTLYTLLNVLKISLEDYIKHKDWPVAENLLDPSMESINREMETLKGIDYTTFKKYKNLLMIEYTLFQQELYNHQDLLQAGLKLKIVISAIKRENLEEQLQFMQKNTGSLKSPLYTSENPKIAQLFNNLLGDVNLLLSKVESFIETLCKHNNKVAEWNKIKQSLAVARLEDMDNI